MPRVSIVMAFLDGANYIREAVGSVFAQTLTDWELILVDDGSKDASAAYAEELARSDPRIRLLTHPGRVNRGLAASRILGSDAASGEYLLFLDHDDMLDPHALEWMTAALEAHPDAGLLFAGTLYWAFDPALGGDDALSSFRPFSTGLVPGRAMLRDLIRSDGRHPAPCSTLYRRDGFLAARDLTAPYDGMYEDTALLMKLLLGNDLYLLDGPVSRYRLHSQSMSHRAAAAGSFVATGFSADRRRFLRWVRRNLRLDWRSRLRLEATLALYRLAPLRRRR